jgi:hypothetical protein
MLSKFKMNLRQYKVFPKETIFLFDWDDTFCPSTTINQYELHKKPIDYENKILFYKLEEIIIEILNICNKLGKIYIVTNADEGWVQRSCMLFFPNLFPILKDYKIISANTKYSKLYPKNPIMWKYLVFSQILHNNYNTNKNVICIGDSSVELEAFKMINKELYYNGIFKSVKLIEQPTVKLLINELIFLKECLTTIEKGKETIYLYINKEQVKENVNKIKEVK